MQYRFNSVLEIANYFKLQAHELRLRAERPRQSKAERDALKAEAFGWEGAERVVRNGIIAEPLKSIDPIARMGDPK